MKRILSVALTLCLMLSVFASFAEAAEYNAKYSSAADELYNLGLFKGTGIDSNGRPVYELERSASRIEVLVMLIRLKGEENAALAYGKDHPFTDVPPWADAYVSFAYNKGYTKGISETVFGSSEVATANMYLTFVLRALGFNDTNGDFDYSTAYIKAAEVGVVESGNYSNQAMAFYRDDCVRVSLNALGTKINGKSTTLINDLVNSGAVSYSRLTPEQKKLVTNIPDNQTKVIIPWDESRKGIPINQITAVFPSAVTLATTAGCRTMYNQNPLISDLVLTAFLDATYYNCTALCDLGSELIYFNTPREGTTPRQSDSNAVQYVNDLYYFILDQNKDVLGYSVFEGISGDGMTFETAVNFDGSDEYQKACDFVDAAVESYNKYTFEVVGTGIGWNDNKGAFVDSVRFYFACKQGLPLSEVYCHECCIEQNLLDSMREFVFTGFVLQSSYANHYDKPTNNYYLNFQLTNDGNGYYHDVHSDNPRDHLILFYDSQGTILGHLVLNPADYIGA